MSAQPRRNRQKRWLIVLLFMGLFVGGGGVGLHAWLFVDLPSPGELPERAAAPSSKILDRNGQLLFEVIDPHLGKHTPLELDDIPTVLQQATIATEDAHFWTNPGIDMRGILRAVWIDLHGGDVIAGGSTITQQVARNLLLTDERFERTMTRKLREAILAWRMSRRFDKQTILALYLNEIYYGNMAYGIEAAAHAYFGKEVGELDLAECTLLAGLPQAPSLYNPMINPDGAQRRQRVVLDLMVKESYLDADEADLAASERLRFVTTPFPIRAPHFVSYAWSTLEQTLGVEQMAQGGYQVQTTIDVDLQERAESIIQRLLETLQAHGEPDYNVNNAALLALDPHTGEILAMVGSADYFDPAGGAVNTCLALRQPGSAIKPITYAAAFDPTLNGSTRWGELPFTPATMLLDVRTAFVTQEGIGYVPLNYDLRWHGPILLREALGSSYNLPAVKVLDAVGIEAMITQSRRMGITSFDQVTERFGLALTLGGGEVQMIELAAAYAALANGGYGVQPVAIRTVNDAHGETIWRSNAQENKQAIDPRVAYLITNILSDEWARLPAFGEQSALYIGRPAAAKTGTTTDWRDNWTVGYTPDLVTAVWVGNVDNSPMYHISGISGAGPIWHDFMTWALKGHPETDFEQPEGLTQVEVCALSGKLPGPYCPHRRQELFITGTEPKEECEMHQLVAIDVATGLQATETTPPERIRRRIYALYPPEAQAWAIEQGLPQPPPLPEHEPQEIQPGDTESQQPALEIVSPFQMDRYRISPALPLEDQRIMVEARPSAEQRFQQVTLYIDQTVLAILDHAPYRVWWPLQPGEHQIYAVGKTVHGETIHSEPITLIVIE